MSRHRCVLCWGLLCSVCGAQAQHKILLQAPEKASLQLDEVYLRNDVEMEREYQEAGGPGSAVTRQRILVQPALGLGFSGFGYHPNLLHYTAQTELGLDWQDARISPGDQETDMRFLQRYHVSLDILRQKPYSTTLFADKDVTYRDYDFFTRVRVDSERFGGRTGYSAGAVPMAVAAQHYEETVEDLSRPSSLTEDTVSFNASNLRREGRGNTQLNYNLNRFSRIDNGYSEQEGTTHNVSLVDSEKFGPEGWVQLTSLLNYNSVVETAQPSDKLLLQEHLRLQHTRNLASFGEYAYDFASLEDSDSSTHQGQVGLTHQLYDNLSSTLSVNGNATHSESPGSALDYRRYGVALNEQYTRRLNTWGNISVGYSGAVNREERDATGATTQIIDEVHTLTDGTLTFLNQRSVLVASIQVTDLTGTIIYLPELDYITIPHPPLTEIRRVPGGRIPNGGTVLVDYVARLDPSASYYSFDNSVSFRLDFWKGRLGFYGRWAKLDFSGAEELDLRWTDSKTVGLDTNWRRFRAGGEYEIVDSNLSPYNRVRLFQSVTIQPSAYSHVSFDLDQSWTEFPDDDVRQNSYGMFVRYQQRLTSWLNWNTEGGARIERGETFDRNYGTVRTDLDCRVGKLAVNLGYEYANESHPTDLQERHFVYFRLRRTF